MAFVHLHVHTQYSLLNGLASISALVDKAIADGMPGIAVTDHGNMFGIKEFFNYVNKVNSKRPDNPFKPIFGCEMYVANKDLHEHTDKHDTGRHLIVLAKNKTGYKNLIKLVSKAWTEGFYSRPRTDKNEIAAHSEGLIICSACIGGEIPRLLLQGDYEEADRRVKWWKQHFGEDYYLEIQRHKATVPKANHETYELQMRIEGDMLRLARENGVKVIATNDVHFVNEEDAEAHDRLICLSTGKLLNDPTRMLYTKQEWMKTQAEMEAIFRDMPEVLANTQEILDKVEPYNIDHGPIMPNYEIPESFGTEAEYRSRLTEQDLFDEFTRDEKGNVVLTEEEAKKKIDKLGGYEKLYRIKFEADYLRELALEGAKKRYGDPVPEDVMERLVFELHIMKTMGFPGYFLIVQDFINTARTKLGVSVGPGRGSAAGSAVAYCLGITQIDPIKYDLLFERFLNPDRISLPDIDVDFDDDGRADVLRYVTDKYGEEKVAHIITYGTMAAKSALKDVARVIDLPLPESNRLTKLIPRRMPEVNGKELKCTLKNCYEYLDDFKRELKNPNPLITDTLKYAKALEGNVRNIGVHACGVIICRDDITDWVPVSTANDKEEGKLLVTQYEGRVIEETGLIKMDFLGLKTLSIIKEALANIKLTRGIDLDIEAIPIDDPKTYKLYCDGRTIGTFQFESPGMQKYLRELQPSTFEDLIAMNALYRPGPMDYIPDFIARKHGDTPIVYDIPVMETYLKDTYGVTVYQEQVMLLSRLLANFTRGESDTLRKAMGKKLIDKMNHLKGKFLEGGQANGHDPKTLEKIWADWEKFASYAFNKSHATCYSWVAFQTAYLKANYPSEYMAAVLSRNLTDITKLTGFMDECKAMRIAVKGPDVNESFSKFGVNAKGDIRFGLSAIKGIGPNVVEDIIKARNAGGKFKDIFDFVERVPAGVVNRRVMESLAISGAFDCFPELQREDYLDLNSKGEALSEQLLRYGAQFQQAQARQEASLFSFDDLTSNNASRPELRHAVPWVPELKYSKERDLVGMYLSGHPLDPFYMEVKYGSTCSIQEVKEMHLVDGVAVAFGCMVSAFETRQSKNGSQYGIIKFEDYSDSMEMRLFGRQLMDFGKFGVVGTPVMVKAKCQKRYNSDEVVLNIESITLLEDFKGRLVNGITINAAVAQIDEDFQKMLLDHKKSSTQHLGSLNLRIYDPAINRSVLMQSGMRIPINRKLVEQLDGLDIDYTVEASRP
ncbi:MAG: DNA polymerase III subunit alpha [Bacteroidales bacterium]|nr:DNA polymerase III subunit alpha [Bacteroidales bacterium]